MFSEVQMSKMCCCMQCMQMFDSDILCTLMLHAFVKKPLFILCYCRYISGYKN
eukprot:c35424_g1_i1 orf=69-227(+)